MVNYRTTANVFCMAFLFALSFAQRGSHAALVDYVNPLRGTNASGAYSHGATVPAVTMPFGFTFYTAMTDIGSGWKYSYQASKIQGFGASHIPSPWIGDWGAFQIMPMTGTVRLAPGERASDFTHAEELSRPHYYRVKLGSYGTTVEITPTMRASAWRFAFPAGTDKYILFDTPDDKGGSVSVNQAAGVVSGYCDDTKKVYFYATVNRPVAASATPSGEGVCGWLRFAAGGVDTVTMNLGTSFISIDQARKNLEQEIGGKSFDEVKELAAAAWTRLLGTIEIEGANEEQKTTFYSCLYRACVYPTTLWEDVDGAPRYAKMNNRDVGDGYMYVNNGFWDTYRTAWPFYTLFMPGQCSRMLQGWLNTYRDDGLVAQWAAPWDRRCMLGTCSDAVFADAFVKGVRGFDSTQAYEAMLKNAMGSFWMGGRNGNNRAPFLGYVPCDSIYSAAAWHLEDCIADFGISQMARALGKEEEHAYFLSRSRNYANIFSPTVGFFRGRKIDGSWRTADGNFYPNEWGHEFVEGCAWTYRTLAMHDGQGLAELFGGRGVLSEKIDEVFNASPDWRVGSYGGDIHEMREARDSQTGQYGHCNEQTFSMIYMYNYAGTPWKTQQRARDVVERLYTSGIGDGKGYIGDEDNGAMSTWYLFSALGFFPCCPGRAEYTIGSPLFTKATIHLENGNDFVISAPGNSPGSRYVQSATLNNASYAKNFLRHQDILAGGTLELSMGSSPSDWGGGEDDVPGSITPPGESPEGTVDITKTAGGKMTACGEISDNEGAAKAFDENSATKWLTLGASCWIQFQLPAGQREIVRMYTLTAANDAPGRDPKSWTLQGSDNGSDWTVLDSRANQDFPLRSYTRAFEFANTRAFQYYRLEISASHGDAALQVAEIELIKQNELLLSTGTAKKVFPETNRIVPTHFTVANGRIDVPLQLRKSSATVAVYNLSGRLVHQSALKGARLDLYRYLNLSRGVYVVRFVPAQTSRTER